MPYYAIMRGVGLPERSFEKRVKDFSKGMRQKLGIAIAITKDAPAMIATGESEKKKASMDFVKKHPKISFATSRVLPQSIDKINISASANRAASRAFAKLTTNNRSLITKAKTYLDGGLYLNSKILTANRSTLIARTLVRGDEKINAIKLASIVAKVTRDKYMTKLHKRYPKYGFDAHKGYGTKKHRQIN